MSFLRQASLLIRSYSDNLPSTFYFLEQKLVSFYIILSLFQQNAWKFFDFSRLVLLSAHFAPSFFKQQLLIIATEINRVNMKIEIRNKNGISPILDNHYLNINLRSLSCHLLCFSVLILARPCILLLEKQGYGRRQNDTKISFWSFFWTYFFCN